MSSLKITYNFKTVDVPDRYYTTLYGINNAGAVVGSSEPLSYGGPPGAFLYSGGTYTTITNSYGIARGINNHNVVVGREGHYMGFSGGFIYQNGTLTDIFHLGGSSNQSDAFDINDTNQVVGNFFDLSTPGGYSQSHGYVWSQSTGKFSVIDYPNAYWTSAHGINNLGMVVGSYSDVAPTTPANNHGFLDAYGHFLTIDAPGASATSANGINDFGEIVGTYIGADGHSHGFVDLYGRFDLIDVSGATDTFINGVNDKGQIVGGYLKDGTEHGFIGTPDLGGTLSNLLSRLHLNLHDLLHPTIAGADAKPQVPTPHVAAATTEHSVANILPPLLHS